jgi:ribosome-associated toxin RatA of RatAB toxin-antitoxin module
MSRLHALPRAILSPLPRLLSPLPPCLWCRAFATHHAAAPPPPPRPSPPGGSDLVRYTERRLLHYPLQHVYSVVSNVSEYKQFVPWCMNSVVVRPPQPGVPLAPLEAELAVGFRLFSERYTSVVTLVPQRSVRAVASGTMLFSHLVNVWEFEPGAAPGTTWLTFRVEFQFKSQLYSAVSQMFFNEVVKNMVRAFEERCKDTLPGFQALLQREAQLAAQRAATQAAAAQRAAAVEVQSVQQLQPASSSSSSSSSSSNNNSSSSSSAATVARASPPAAAGGERKRQTVPPLPPGVW